VGTSTSSEYAAVLYGISAVARRRWMDNTIADHLGSMFRHAGFVDVRETPAHEIITRQDPDFATRLGLWAEVAAARGHQMVADGLLTETQRATTEAEYRAWMQTEAEAQTLYLLTVEGTVP
jgi:hypothetical protein